MTHTTDAIARFRALHAAGCFVIPNPWDVGSAVLLAHLGFKALATSSAGLAFTLGRPDGNDVVSLDDTLAHLRAVAAATALPVNADFQNGFAAAGDHATLAANVTAAVATGVSGLSVEDATGDHARPLYDRDEAVARVVTARKAIDATGSGVVLTARCEAALFGVPDAERVALDRLVAFAEAGADCLFAPGIVAPDAIAAIVRAVAPRPVNVLMSRPAHGLTVAHLADLGVRRISLGSALARVALGAFMNAARSLRESGNFDALTDAATFAELNGIFAARD